MSRSKKFKLNFNLKFKFKFKLMFMAPPPAGPPDMLRIKHALARSAHIFLTVIVLFTALWALGMRPYASYLCSLSLISFVLMLLDKAHAKAGCATLNVCSPSVTPSKDGLVVENIGDAWGGARACKGLGGGGAAYFEVTVKHGLCRVGWSTERASLELGTDRFGFGFDGTGFKSNGGMFEPYGEAFSDGDVVGCFLEVREGTAFIKFSKNERILGEAFQLRLLAPLYPAVCLQTRAKLGVNFGGNRGALRLPPGFISIDDLRQHTAETERSKPRRVPEDVLHALNVLGGTPGIILGMLVANHKRSCKKVGGTRSDAASAWMWGKPGEWWWAFVPCVALSFVIHLPFLLQ